MPIRRITGPYAGHYVAARAEYRHGGWQGFAKVFDHKPAPGSDFDTEPGAVADVVGSWVEAPSELDAVQSAERVARNFIAQLTEDDA
ncbi:MAG TPA: hypothetical protein VLA61_27520 [Ideonella sp.]|uniref:hypothetical protein n=1 Tax=Ideonella sp. TaxID=1929293 RepID=UPI002CC5015C|nr:hypothetical protein [Ideonella sp.]HSI52033.1 hypothetical protein [Ideonella sp.]